ncbi:MAG TPA: 7TM diverse intracellular signaling domain-containing protein [Mucilaginibacter sp.]|nr:7TM diverse intracellular signaling domain-containing protein [Mucilaginibacter sp.]
MNRLYNFFFKGLILIAFLHLANKARAQQEVVMSDQADQHIFTYHEIECLEDPKGTLQFSQVSSGEASARFKASWSSTPQNYNIGSVYWYRIRIKHPSATKKRWILEFFDQTIDDITAYIPDGNGTYQSKHFGALNKFGDRTYHHKNFEVNLDIYPDKELTYYFRIKSHQTADVIIVLRSVGWFIQYALDEYLLFGVFYGMILVFAFYNLLMFIAVKQRQYLYYILYNLSVAFYELCTDGVGYEYLWPGSPGWNQYAYGFALCCVSVSALIFTDKLLFVKTNTPWLHKLIWGVIGLRVVYFFVCFFVDKQWFNYKFLEFIPLCIAFFTGVYVFLKGYRPARFFVLGYSFLVVGFVIKILTNFGQIDLGTVGYYSLSICFILEMIFFALALGDQVRILKRTRDNAQIEMIRQLKEKEKFKESINIQLEKQVQERTAEVIDKARIIEHQNEELNRTNEVLQRQAEEILRMNRLLEKDKEVLQHDFEKVARDRIMSTEVDFEEFSKIYPDADSCYRLLAELKWKQGYKCHKCGNEHSFSGRTSYSRKCTKCSHEESVTAFTLLHNIRIPITKGFYLIFLVYSSNGKISSHKLAEILEIRQSTCWQYSNRIKKLLSPRPRKTKPESGEGWSKLLLEDVHVQ